MPILRCVQPVNKASARQTIDLPVHAFATHTHSPPGAPQHPAADNRSQLVNEQRANQLGQKLNGEWDHAGLTVALSGNFGKAGNPG